MPENENGVPLKDREFVAPKENPFADVSDGEIDALLVDTENNAESGELLQTSEAEEIAEPISPVQPVDEVKSSSTLSNLRSKAGKWGREVLAAAALSVGSEAVAQERLSRDQTAEIDQRTSEVESEANKAFEELSQLRQKNKVRKTEATSQKDWRGDVDKRTDGVTKNYEKTKTAFKIFFDKSIPFEKAFQALNDLFGPNETGTINLNGMVLEKKDGKILINYREVSPESRPSMIK